MRIVYPDGDCRLARPACDAVGMHPVRPLRQSIALPLALALAISVALGLGLAGCKPAPPFAQLSGVLLDPALVETSGLAASGRHEDVLWLLNDGGNAPRLYAVSVRGSRIATLTVAGVANTDWEDLAAFELDGKRYLMIADTGDNGGLRRTLQLHVIEEPSKLEDAVIEPAWSIAFRWPDGARDCEAVAVDSAQRQVLLISKKRQPPELFALPLRPAGTGLQTAHRIGALAGVPQATAEEKRIDPQQARIRHQVTAASVSPDRRNLAVLTYAEVLLYPKRGKESWARAVARTPGVHPLPLLPQPEALGWSADGRGLFAAGELSPSPLFYLNPRYNQ